jgi:hypothetical protein
MTSSIKPRDQCLLSPAGPLPGIGTWRQPGARWRPLAPKINGGLALAPKINGGRMPLHPVCGMRLPAACSCHPSGGTLVLYCPVAALLPSPHPCPTCC